VFLDINNIDKRLLFKEAYQVTLYAKEKRETKNNNFDLNHVGASIV
jgi:hypothetical protein